MFLETNNYYNDYANYVNLFVVLHHVVAAHSLVFHSAAVDFMGDDQLATKYFGQSLQLEG